jgi:DNA-binding response OmpR family regulator
MEGLAPVEAGDTILVVEDDPSIVELVELYLRREGFAVLRAATGERGLQLAAERNPLLVVLDLGLEGSIDGIEVCRRLRATSRVPVVMVTARDDEIDRVLGFEVGADDYVVKPFSPRELVARVRAILRRVASEGAPGPAPDAPARFGEVCIDRARHEVRVAGAVVHLATREYDLLAYLADNAGLALTRRQILDGAWDPGWYGDERTVDVHVGQLRRKLGSALPLATVRGVGYRLG